MGIYIYIFINKINRGISMYSIHEYKLEIENLEMQLITKKE